MVNRITFWVALFGILLTTFMWIQKQNGFDNGCFGMPAPKVEAASVSGCQEAMESESGDFLGVDNVVAGFFFYTTLGVLAFAMLFSSGAVTKLIGNLKLGLSGGGLVFSFYLMYVLFFDLQVTCKLCILSATAIATMFGFELTNFLKKRPFVLETAEEKFRELSIFSFSAFVVGALALSGQFLTANGNAGSSSASGDVRATVNEVIEQRFDQSFLTMMAPCEIDDSKMLLTAWQDLLDEDDPVMGNPNSPVKVIDLFDPNCPHCKQVHNVLKPIVQQYGDRVAFYYKPFPLWQKSIAQVHALWLANDQGRYFNMVELLFQAQQKEPMSQDQLFQIARSAGLNMDTFKQGVESSKYIKKVSEYKERTKNAGISSAPIVLLNGNFVGKKSQTLTNQCLSKLIEEELSRNGQ